MKRILVVYHSTTGGTLQMAQACADGARAEPAVQVELRHARAALAEDVIGADGFVFATPENLAAMSGLMKDFFDRCYYEALGRINGRPYAALVCAGSDGAGAARQLERIATGWRLRAIAPSLIVCTHAQSAEEIARPKRIDAAQLVRCRELGTTLAAGLALGIY